LAAIVRDKKNCRSAHISRMLRYLAEFEVRNPSIDADIANAIELFSLLPFAAP
jgi:hypothetical protein